MNNIPIDKYKNYLDCVSFTYSDAVNIISNIKYIKNDSKVDEVEKDKVPFFVYSFYKCVIMDNIIPNQPELWNKYFNVMNNEFFDKSDKYIEGTMFLEGLKGRFCRSYPSLLREFVFALRAKEVLTDYKVLYNDRLDVLKGIDLFLEKNNKYFGVKLYLDTINSRNKAKLKEYRHKNPYSDVNYLDLVFKSEFNDTEKIYLYTDEYIDELVKEMKKY